MWVAGQVTVPASKSMAKSSLVKPLKTKICLLLMNWQPRGGALLGVHWSGRLGQSTEQAEVAAVVEIGHSVDTGVRRA